MKTSLPDIHQLDLEPKFYLHFICSAELCNKCLGLTQTTVSILSCLQDRQLYRKRNLNPLGIWSTVMFTWNNVWCAAGEQRHCRLPADGGSVWVTAA